MTKIEVRKVHPAVRMTQRAAVKRALAAGKETPSEGVAYIKERFGITLTNPTFSTIKCQIKKAAHPRAMPISAAARTTRGAAITIDLARQVKELVERYGADSVKELVAVFAE
jgi:hypothetical protein